MRPLVLSMIIVLALLFVSTTALAAPATKELFFATIAPTEGPSPETCKRFWLDEEGILHVRGCVQTGPIEGDIKGEIEITSNLNLDVNTGNGDGQVKGMIYTDGEAAYIISVDVTFTGWKILGTFVAHGVGGFEGTHIMGTVTGMVEEPVELTGTMLTTKT